VITLVAAAMEVRLMIAQFVEMVWHIWRMACVLRSVVLVCGRMKIMELTPCVVFVSRIACNVLMGYRVLHVATESIWPQTILFASNNAIRTMEPNTEMTVTPHAKTVIHLVVHALEVWIRSVPYANRVLPIWMVVCVSVNV
jgi:hypothetical protein